MHVPCQSGTTAPWAPNLWWSKVNLQPYIDSTQITADDGQDDQLASVAILASRARCWVPRGAARGALSGPSRARCVGCQTSLRGLSSGQCSPGVGIVIKAQGCITMETGVCRSLIFSRDAWHPRL